MMTEGIDIGRVEVFIHAKNTLFVAKKKSLSADLN